MTAPDVSTASEPEIGRADISGIERLIRPYIRLTPVVELRGQDFGLSDIHLPARCPFTRSINARRCLARAR